MALTYVAERYAVATNSAGSGVASETLSLNSNTKIGNTLIFGIGGNTGVVSSVTDDSGGNTWVIDNQPTPSSTGFVAIIRCPIITQITSSSVITVNYSTNVKAREKFIVEFSGLSSSPLDRTAFANTTTATTHDSGTTSATTQDFELIVSMVHIDGTSVGFAKPSAYFNSATTLLSANNNEGMFLWKTVSTTGTQRCQPTTTSTIDGDGAVCTYKQVTSLGSNLYNHLVVADGMSRSEVAN